MRVECTFYTLFTLHSPLMSKIKLILAILLFVVLDLSVLLINYRISHQVYEDTIAINLAGRQRMLSQRITKVLLQLEKTPEQQPALAQELNQSLNLFMQTLNGFSHGAMVTGGDGRPVYLQQLTQDSERQLLLQTQAILAPILPQAMTFLNGPIPDDVIATTESMRQYALQHNQAILTMMNDLTFALEQASQQRVNLLRLIQTIIFVLALINFVVILRQINRKADEALALSAHFNQLAIHDALTGLYNRRHFEQTLERLVDEASDAPVFSLLMLDLDHFKPVNDRHGHNSGDEVLRIIAQRLSNHLRPADTLARLGGDEFALICPGMTSQQDLHELCQRLIATIEQPILLANGQQVQVSVSIGVAFYPAHAHDIGELVRKADKTLYAAKSAGRGRWLLATS